MNEDPGVVQRTKINKVATSDAANLRDQSVVLSPRRFYIFALAVQSKKYSSPSILTPWVCLSEHQTSPTRRMNTMLPRSGIYYAAQHMHHAQRVTLPPHKINDSEITSAGYREELGVFLRLWLVILAGVAVILLSSWLVTS
ncbi:hypothetical protein [Phyllobacterium chamaecytisi]|uniref:hypothetical protein n=1 Tax=Phyllobacterium chamaecytisi TaxID=2876082 RepID=UPI001CCF5676|nr:hypothetical protein [Phyllobacterium sp. KW56]MBZ9603677.1 hypothetical protein [Phyllobacterium sp. KW56]